MKDATRQNTCIWATTDGGVRHRDLNGNGRLAPDADSRLERDGCSSGPGPGSIAMSGTA